MKLGRFVHPFTYTHYLEAMACRATLHDTAVCPIFELSECVFLSPDEYSCINSISPIPLDPPDEEAEFGDMRVN